jgi:hypothetical protein
VDGLSFHPLASNETPAPSHIFIFDTVSFDIFTFEIVIFGVIQVIQVRVLTYDKQLLIAFPWTALPNVLYE